MGSFIAFPMISAPAYYVLESLYVIWLYKT